MKAAALFYLSFCGSLFAASSLQINWSTSRELFDLENDRLSVGTTADGDGTLLQLGYYSNATLSNPFSGNWITLAVSSMGDTGMNLPGRFSTSTTFTEGDFTPPAVGTPLAIRFFDGTSVANSSFYNVASATDGSWNWTQPTDQGAVLNLTITKADSVFLSGFIDQFTTSLAVPEPSSILSAGLSVALVLCRRTRVRR